MPGASRALPTELVGRAAVLAPNDVRVANFYRYRPKATVDPARIDEAIAEVLEREPSVHDSHPAPRGRIAWAEALGATGEGASDDEGAWSLFENREAIEEQMTDRICHALAMHHGIYIHRDVAET